MVEQKEAELRQVAAHRAKQLEQMLVQREQKLKEQDAIIQALAKKNAHTEQELGQRTQLVSEYESRFVQVREAIEGEKLRF